MALPRRSVGATPPASFVEGFAIYILNPAIISFYLAVVPTFVPASPPPYYFALLAATHILLAFVCHAGWATAFHALRVIVARPGVRMTLELAERRRHALARRACWARCSLAACRRFARTLSHAVRRAARHRNSAFPTSP